MKMCQGLEPQDFLNMKIIYISGPYWPSEGIGVAAQSSPYPRLLCWIANLSDLGSFRRRRINDFVIFYEDLTESGRSEIEPQA